MPPENQRFSDVVRGYRRGILFLNRLKRLFRLNRRETQTWENIENNYIPDLFKRAIEIRNMEVFSKHL